ncbi:Npt1/Npt2 family nucleotide transporter [Paenibacillus alba]|uniref:ADP,ATP carrier protein n=1 Tax=Paenibacillus alba TaxID=1197127 RepID=A0ABU6GAK6_9BACL|nr:Npt1/Npt2 family nucleotide transporter [Paenibacillus alba]MEC0231228.1 Npt1/Npt2 family nucleotide transporter [Paenibacillus alba]
MNGIGSSQFYQTFLHKFAQDKKEYRKVFLLFAYLFFVVSASTIGRTAADTLFLSRFDNSYLSLMYLPQALVMITAGILFQRYSPKVRLDSLMKSLIPLISVLVLVSRLGVGLELRWVFPVIYIGYDVFNFLMIVCFWQFATSVMDQRKAKQMIGIVGSGGITGGILSGFGLKALVPLVGTANLIYFYAGLQLLGLVAVYLILRITKDTLDNKPVQPRTTASKMTVPQKAGLFASVPHLKYVAILSAALVVSLTLIDYQFKVILRGTLQNEALAGFMGSFYGFSGLIALFVQLFISGRILTRFGVMTALLIFPIALIAGSLGILIVPVLAMAVMVKGSDKVIGDTIYSSVSQLVMFPVPPEWRGKAKGFLDGIVRNGAKGLAAICLLVVTRFLAPEQLSYLIVALLAVGILAGVKVKKAYLSTLLANLKKGGDDREKIELNLMDAVSRQILIDALSGTDKQQALYAFGLLREMDTFDLTPHVKGLLHHSIPEMVIEALIYVEQKVPEGFEADLQSLVAEGDNQVKAKALLALAAYAKEAYVDEITKHLDAPSVDVQAAAIAGLVKYYSIEGMFRAVGKLKEMMESGEEEERIAMAALFGQIRVKNFYKPLISLLHDHSPQVRIRALESAAILHVPPLLAPIIAMLKDSQTRRYAISALAAYDEDDVLPPLMPYLDQKEVGLHVPAVFERFATQSAFDRLFAYYETASYDMRDRIVESLLRMQRREPFVDTKKAEAYIVQELHLYGQFAEHGSCLVGVDGHADIADIVNEIRAAISRRIFQLLSLIHDEMTMQAVFLDWSEGDTRQQANAEEVIDQTLQGSLRTEMTKLMAASRKMMRSSAANGQIEAHLSWLSAQGDDWLTQSIQHLILQRFEASQDNELADLMHRVKLLRHVSLFHGMTSKDLSEIAQRLHKMDVPKGTIIIQEGDPGDSLMLMGDGHASVHRNGQLLGELKRGDCFGEMAILTQGPRTASIRAEEDSLLWRLDSSVFYDMMFDQTSIAVEMMKLLSRRLRSELERGQVADKSESAPKLAEAAVGSELLAAKSTEDLTKDEVLLRRILVLQKIDLFAHLAPDDFLWLAQMVDEVAFAPGETICQAGDFGDTMYGIIEGSIRVHRGSEEYAVLQEGSFFGEMAIIDSGPRSADCTAKEATLLLQLHRDQVMTFCFQNIDVLRSMMRVIADRLRGMI